MRRLLQSRIFKIVVIATAVIGIYLFVGLKLIPRCTAYKSPCSSNCNAIGKAMILYAQDNFESLPDSNWCDKLIAGGYITPDKLICPKSGAKKGQCSYAMNKAVVNRKLSELPPNLILVFETRPSWKAVGTKSDFWSGHENNRMGNFLCCDGQSCFETDANSLRWQVDTNEDQIAIVKYDGIANKGRDGLSQKLRHVSDIAATIKPGESRRDIEKYFHHDGGLSVGYNGYDEDRYDFKEWPFIKVNVVFQPADPNYQGESKDDKIISISKPYYEEPSYD